MSGARRPAGRTARARTARGYTLIELVAGAAVMLLALAAATMVLLGAVKQRRRQLELAAMERDSQLLLGPLTSELRQVGLGVPRGSNPEAGGARIPAPVLLADAGEIIFMADLSRPNSSFNGLSRLSDDQSSIGGNGIAILNELNGTCDVDGAGHCRTDQQSALFPPSTDCATSPIAPTCPWSLRKYQGNEWIVMTNGAGSWIERQISPGLHVLVASRRVLSLSAPRPVGFFAGTPNRGFAATPDRVFYRLSGGVVERKQCWGQIGGALTIPILTTPCAAGPDGTPWEPRAGNVSALVFEYRDAADAVLGTPVAAADLRRIRRVVVQLTLQRPLTPGPVTASATASATVRL